MKDGQGFPFFEEIPGTVPRVSDPMPTLSVARTKIVHAVQICIAVSLAVYMGWLIIAPGSDIRARDIWLATLVLLLAVALVALRVVFVSEDRFAWLSMAVALFLWVMGNILYDIQYGTSDEGPTTSANVSNFVYIASYLFMYLCVFFLINTRHRRKSSSFAVVLNALMIIAVSLAYLSVVSSQVASSQTFTTVTSILSFGDLFLSMMLLSFLIAVADIAKGRVELVWWFLIAGVGLLWYADTEYYMSPSYVYGTFLDATWEIGLVLLAFASWQKIEGRFVTTTNTRSLVTPIAEFGKPLR